MNKRKGTAVFVLGFAALLLCTPARAQNSKLDAPVSQQPTVRSEIVRGNRAAKDCDLPEANLTNPIKFAKCVDNAASTNVRNSTLSEPFEFGLYVTAIGLIHIKETVLKINGSTKGMLGMVPKWRNVWHDRMGKITETSKLSFGDFCEAMGARDLQKCEIAVRSDVE